jgi:glycosyltransferase involved in cell wall biosynthesis
MRVLKPTVTILQTIHLKPSAREAIESVLEQTRCDFELVVLDSGMYMYDHVQKDVRSIMSDISSQYRSHPLIDWYITGENKDLHKRKCPISWVTNEAIRAGLVRGKYFCTFYDDDLYYPDFIEKMAGYLDANPDCDAVRCSQNRTFVNPDDTKGYTEPLMATDFISGQNFDCVVDGGQVMMRSSVLDKIGDPWLPEDPDWNVCSHSDGVFFNKLGAVIDKMHFIPDILMENRKMPYSTYSPTEVKK